MCLRDYALADHPISSFPLLSHLAAVGLAPRYSPMTHLSCHHLACPPVSRWRPEGAKGACHLLVLRVLVVLLVLVALPVLVLVLLVRGCTGSTHFFGFHDLKNMEQGSPTFGA